MPAPQLKAQKIIEIIDRAVHIYRNNFLLFLSIIAVLYVPYLLVNTFINVMFMAPLQAQLMEQQKVGATDAEAQAEMMGQMGETFMISHIGAHAGDEGSLGFVAVWYPPEMDPANDTLLYETSHPGHAATSRLNSPPRGWARTS